MDVTLLFIHTVMYDVVNDIIFESFLPIQKLEIKFKNKIHNNVDDVDEIKYSGKIKNTGDDGIILLGCL